MGKSWRMGFGRLTAAAGLGLLTVAGAIGQEPRKTEAPGAQTKEEPKAKAQAKVAPKAEEPAAPSGVPLPLPGIENAFRISPRIYSGGQPSSRESFRALKDLGIKTLLTVDGAEPDVETARAYGLKYVHIPIGYDGVPRDRALRMALAVKSLPGPIFIHCHHGKHRGPAAVAVCAAVVEGWTPKQGTDWMQRAGTSPDYPGLYESISKFQVPRESDPDWKAAVAAGAFPEKVKPPAIIDAMVEVDAIFDRLKAAQKAGFPGGSNASRDATLLREQFAELLRLPRSQDDAFGRAARGASLQATNLEAALRAGDMDAASQSMNAAMKSCTNCHKMFRDAKGNLNRKDAKDAEAKKAGD